MKVIMNARTGPKFQNKCGWVGMKIYPPAIGGVGAYRDFNFIAFGDE